MNSNNALITELNQKIEYYLEQEEYDRAEEICRELCLMEGLEPADCMPESFLRQLKRKEHETMNRKNISKRISGIAVAAAAFLLIGGTVSAAALHNGNIHFFDRGLTAGDYTVDTSEPVGTAGMESPEMSEESIITPISVEEGSADNPWLSKSVWEDTSEIYASDDAVHWTKGYQTTRVTEYKYADYFTAAEDAGFDKLFTTNYTGDVSYYQHEHLEDGADTDYSISGEFVYGNGHFSIDQMKLPAEVIGGADPETEPVLAVITTTGETANEREYISSSGIPFKLSDDTEFGYTRTTTVFRGKTFDAILEFMYMTEEEIHQVLDNIQL